jgi:dihydrodipicolinate synthase/N-acetylneuraminate lyase
MKPLSASEILGNWATLLLPINADDSIDGVRLSDEIARLISFCPDGIYSNGTAGEFYNLTEREFDESSELLASHCTQADMPFQIGVGHMSPLISLERLKRVIALRPAAVQVILPDWFVPTLDECISFLDRMAEVSEPVGLVLYNPPHAKKVVTSEEIGQLKDTIPLLVGVKVCDGDDDWYARMRRTCRGLSVFVPGHHLATGIRNGAHGSYSNVACLHPGAAQQWWRQIHTAPEAAMQLEQRIRNFMDRHIVPLLQGGYSNMAVDKLLAAIGGWGPVGTRLRWPYRWITEEAVAPLRTEARKILPEFFVCEGVCRR